MEERTGRQNTDSIRNGAGVNRICENLRKNQARRDGWNRIKTDTTDWSGKPRDSRTTWRAARISLDAMPNSAWGGILKWQRHALFNYRKPWEIIGMMETEFQQASEQSLANTIFAFRTERTRGSAIGLPRAAARKKNRVPRLADLKGGISRRDSVGQTRPAPTSPSLAPGFPRVPARSSFKLGERLAKFRHRRVSGSRRYSYRNRPNYCCRCRPRKQNCMGSCCLRLVYPCKRRQSLPWRSGMPINLVVRRKKRLGLKQLVGAHAEPTFFTQ